MKRCPFILLSDKRDLIAGYEKHAFFRWFLQSLSVGVLGFNVETDILQNKDKRHISDSWKIIENQAVRGDENKSRIRI